MAATAVATATHLPFGRQLSGLFNSIGELLNENESESYRELFSSTLGSRYDSCSTVSSLFEALARDRRIRPDNLQLIESTLGNSELISKRQEVVRLIQRFKNGLPPVASLALSSIYGREKEIREMLNVFNRGPERGLLLHGPPGVGKTTLAEGFLSKINKAGTQMKRVDVRGLRNFETLLSSVAFLFDKAISPNDITLTVIIDVIKSQLSRTILFLDNADHYMNQMESDSENMTKFSQLIHAVTFHNDLTKVVITSCQSSEMELFKHLIHQIKVEPLEIDSALQIVREVSGKDVTSSFDEVAKFCRYSPLNLRLLSSLLQFNGEVVSSLLQQTSTEHSISLMQKMMQRENKPRDVAITEAILCQSFTRLSDTIQQIAVALSVFPQAFKYDTVLFLFEDMDERKVNIALQALCHIELIHVVKGNEGHFIDHSFEIHPVVKQYLTDQSHAPLHKDYHAKFKSSFARHYTSKMKHLAAIINVDYQESLKQYNANEGNFNIVFDMCAEDELLIDEDDFAFLHNLNSLFEAALPVAKRVSLYASLAQVSRLKGKPLLAVEYYGLASLQALKTMPDEARQFMLEGELLLTSENKQSKQIDMVTSLYYFTQGEMIYQENISYPEEEKLKKGLELHMEALRIREEQLTDINHADLFRSFNAIGNFHIKLASFSGVTEGRDYHLDKALTFYSKAVGLQDAIHSHLHLDMPLYLQNLASLYEEMKRWSDAIRMYEKAIAVDKEIGMEGRLGNALIMKNLANLYIGQQEFEKALPLAKEACRIRQMYLGAHVDTVRSIYSLSVVLHGMNKYRDGIACYLKAFEMEESLQRHSPVRDFIPEDLQGLIAEGIANGCKELLMFQDYFAEVFSKLKFVQGTYMETFLSDDIRCRSEDESVMSWMYSHLGDESFNCFDVGPSGGSFVSDSLGVSVVLPVTTIKHCMPLSLSEVQPRRPFCPSQEIFLSKVIAIKGSIDLFQGGSRLIMDCNLTRLPDTQFLEVDIKKFDGSSETWVSLLTDYSLRTCFDREIVQVSTVVTAPGIFVVSLYIREFAYVIKPHEDLAIDYGAGNPSLVFFTGCIEREVGLLIQVNHHSDGFRDDAHSPAGPMLLVQLGTDHLHRPCIIRLPVDCHRRTPRDSALHLLKWRENQWEAITQFDHSRQDEVWLEVQDFSVITLVWSYFTTANDVLRHMSPLPVYNFLSFNYDVILFLFKKNKGSSLGLCQLRAACAPVAPAHELRLRQNSSNDEYDIEDSEFCNQKLKCGEKMTLRFAGRYKTDRDVHLSFFSHRPNWVNVTLADTEPMEAASTSEVLFYLPGSDATKETNFAALNRMEFKAATLDAQHACVEGDRWQFLGIPLDGCHLDDFFGVEMWMHLTEIGVCNDDVARISSRAASQSLKDANRLCMEVLTSQFASGALKFDLLAQKIKHFGPRHLVRTLQKVLDIISTPEKLNNESSTPINLLLEIVCNNLGYAWRDLALNLRVTKADILAIAAEDAPEQTKCYSSIRKWANHELVSFHPILAALQRDTLTSLKSRPRILSILNLIGQAIIKILQGESSSSEKERV